MNLAYIKLILKLPSMLTGIAQLQVRHQYQLYPALPEGSESTKKVERECLRARGWWRVLQKCYLMAMTRLLHTGIQSIYIHLHKTCIRSGHIKSTVWIGGGTTPLAVILQAADGFRGRKVTFIWGPETLILSMLQWVTHAHMGSTNRALQVGIIIERNNHEQLGINKIDIISSIMKHFFTVARREKTDAVTFCVAHNPSTKKGNSTFPMIFKK